MSKALLAVTLLAVVAVVNAQFIPWADPFAAKNSTAAKTVVPKCGGSKSQCYEQTSGQPDVTITGYYVTSNTFPCSSGKTSTGLDFDLKVALKDGECKVRCDGFGCSDTSIKVCGESFGFPQCPQPAGKVSVLGKAGDCSSGFGDYTVTITCPQFEFVTYISY